jgi:hypothetical protein
LRRGWGADDRQQRGRQVDVAEAKRSTLELLGSSNEEDVAYIDEDLLAEFESAEEATESEADEAPPEGAPEVAPMAIRVFYGNSLVYGTPRGRLHFKNGSPNRPNDPCGRMYRRWVQMTPGSPLNPFRNCGGYWGYQIVVY